MLNDFKSSKKKHGGGFMTFFCYGKQFCLPFKLFCDKLLGVYCTTASNIFPRKNYMPFVYKTLPNENT